MIRRLLTAVLAACVLSTAPLSAHPVPFSYLDLRIQKTALDASLVIHVTDLGHDLNITPAERLLDPAFAKTLEAEIAALVQARLRIGADGRTVTLPWTGIEVVADRNSVRLQAHVPLDRPVSSVTVDGPLFLYEPEHQTFINIYDDTELTQAIIAVGRSHVEYFVGVGQGITGVITKFIPEGAHHILIGPDHILFLIGLLLLGGSLKRLALIVTGFTIAHSITLSVAALNIFSPPARLIEPAIALSIVYVGVDNLLIRQGRDFRAWIAFGFGFIHGFGFANVLREMALPARALGWSLFSFNVGVEIGQLLIVVVVATALAAVRTRNEVWGRRLVVGGSIVVIAAGAFWFVQRIVFPGGM
jgi:hypothetical protein